MIYFMQLVLYCIVLRTKLVCIQFYVLLKYVVELSKQKWIKFVVQWGGWLSQLLLITSTPPSLPTPLIPLPHSHTVQINNIISLFVTYQFGVYLSFLQFIWYTLIIVFLKQFILLFRFPSGLGFKQFSISLILLSGEFIRLSVVFNRLQTFFKHSLLFVCIQMVYQLCLT